MSHMVTDVPLSPEVAAHVASFMNLDSIEIPETGFLFLRAPKSMEQSAESVGHAIAGLTGAIVFIGRDDFSLESVDDEVMEAFGWTRA